MIKIYSNKNKEIICPNCHTHLTMADALDDRIHKLACKRCRKWIWFKPMTGETEIKKIPPRTASSGKRFY